MTWRGGGKEGECCVLGLSLQVAMVNWTGLKNEEPYYLRSQDVGGWRISGLVVKDVVRDEVVAISALPSMGWLPFGLIVT